MKKIIAILLIAIISLGAAGCKNDSDYTYESTVSMDEEEISSYAPPKLEGSEEYDLVDFDEFVVQCDNQQENESVKLSNVICEGDLENTDYNQYYHDVGKWYYWFPAENWQMDILTNLNNEVLYVNLQVPRSNLEHLPDENQDSKESIDYLTSYFLAHSALIYFAMGGGTSPDDAYELIWDYYIEEIEGEVETRYLGDYEYGFGHSGEYVVFTMRSPWINQ